MLNKELKEIREEYASLMWDTYEGDPYEILELMLVDYGKDFEYFQEKTVTVKGKEVAPDLEDLAHLAYVDIPLEVGKVLFHPNIKMELYVTNIEWAKPDWVGVWKKTDVDVVSSAYIKKSASKPIVVEGFGANEENKFYIYPAVKIGRAEDSVPVYKRGDTRVGISARVVTEEGYILRLAFSDHSDTSGTFNHYAPLIDSIGLKIKLKLPTNSEKLYGFQKLFLQGKIHRKLECEALMKTLNSYNTTGVEMRVSAEDLENVSIMLDGSDTGNPHSAKLVSSFTDYLNHELATLDAAIVTYSALIENYKSCLYYMGMMFIPNYMIKHKLVRYSTGSEVSNK